MATGDSARVILPRYELARQGRIFSGNIAAAGVVLPIYSNTTQQCGLWNPAGSSVDVVLLRVALTYVGTTAAAGGYVIGYLPAGAPAVAATGASIAAFTETTPVNLYVRGGNAAQAKFGQGATITVTAPSVLTHLSVSQNAFTAAGTGQMAFYTEIKFDGELVLPPGNAIFVAGNIATLATWAGSVVWAEVDRTA
jgi:hypothetical protein